MVQANIAKGAPPRAAAARPLRLVLLALAILAAAAITVERVWLAAVQPLWFDEAWSAFVAMTPDWRGVAHEARVDVNAPLYYALLHAWTAIAGTSDLALRTPGLLAVAAAAALPLALRVRGLAPAGRLALGAIVYGWWGVDVFLAGRCYGLLLALSMLQCLLFAQLLRRPSRRTALAWCVAGSAAILTHYYALIVTLAQGLLYLAAGRGRALRTWPAALAFAPAFGWLAWHAPRLHAFTAGSVAWHSRLDAAQAAAMTGFAFDPANLFVGLGVAALLTPAMLWLSRRTPSDAAETGHLWLAAAASLAALVLTLASGVLHPSLTGRYLIPAAPGLLLGLVLLAGRTPWPRAAWTALAALYLAAALRPAAFADGLKSQSPYGFETASQSLIAQGVTDVVFAWDHEVTALMPPATLQGLGSVFFRRAGAPVAVEPLVVRPTDDVNAAALAAAHGARPGIIWIYNRAGRTAAAARPPRIAELDPRWRCRRIGDATVGSLACWRP
jgi:hypothetical protein